ncbi:MAG: peptidase M28, partial [Alphaproteobacteria bacterium HGW-Alphaproteobacteria-15]
MIGAPARLFLAVLVSLTLTACALAPITSAPLAERAAIEQRLMADIAVLASDDFGGRKPGTPGEDKTLAFLE